MSSTEPGKGKEKKKLLWMVQLFKFLMRKEQRGSKSTLSQEQLAREDLRETQPLARGGRRRDVLPETQAGIDVRLQVAAPKVKLSQVHLNTALIISFLLPSTLAVLRAAGLLTFPSPERVYLPAVSELRSPLSFPKPCW